MASRDKSQGFGFVYTNLSKLLAERDSLPKEAMGPITVDPKTAINFNKTPKSSEPNVAVDETRNRTMAVAQIKENLDRLQALHHKLHAMLAEINDTTDRKKK